MEVYEVVGYREVDVTDDRGRVQGYTLYVTCVPDNDHIIGTMCDKVFINSSRVRYVPQVGDTVRLIYNRYGKVGAVETC